MIYLIDQSYDQHQRTFGVDTSTSSSSTRFNAQCTTAIGPFSSTSTATGWASPPRAEDDCDTYHMFWLESGVPTFAYKLKVAVTDSFLVPPIAVSVPIKFHRQAIKYKDLSPAERLSYEEKFTDALTEDIPYEVEG
jgi:type I restriction enzyme R subunit